jgi:hypothetical protein
MITASCPDCDNQLILDTTPEIGQLLRCVNCHKMLEVTWLFPVCLDYQEREEKISAEQDENLE